MQNDQRLVCFFNRTIDFSTCHRWTAATARWPRNKSQIPITIGVTYYGKYVPVNRECCNSQEKQLGWILLPNHPNQWGAYSYMTKTKTWTKWIIKSGSRKSTWVQSIFPLRQIDSVPVNVCLKKFHWPLFSFCIHSVPKNARPDYPKNNPPKKLRFIQAACLKETSYYWSLTEVSPGETADYRFVSVVRLGWQSSLPHLPLGPGLGGRTPAKKNCGVPWWSSTNDIDTIWYRNQCNE